MTLTTKKALFVGYVLLALSSLLFRVTAYSILRYFYLVVVVVTSTAIIMRYTNHRMFYYVLPLAISMIVGLILSFMGITGYYDQFTGESVVVLGVSLFLAAVIAYFLKGVFTKFLFTHKYVMKPKVQLVFSFLLFFGYFTWISSPIVTIIEEGAILTLVALLGFNVLYFALHYFLIRFTKQVNFIWIALIGMVVLYIVFRFYFYSASPLLLQMYSIYLSYGLFISIILIGDIYYLINLES